MAELCFNCMNRSAYLLGDEDPDLHGQIRAASQAGFRLIGPDSYSIRAYCAKGGRLEELAERIRGAGMRVFELPALMLGDGDESRKDAEELLAMARVLRPDFLQVNVTGVVDAKTLAEIRRVGEDFAACGTRLAIEYLPWLPDIKNLESTRAMLDRLDLDGAGVIVDTWHFFFSDDTWEGLAALPLDEIAYIQFDDHPERVSDDLVAETVGRRVMPGSGTFELDRFCDLIRAKGFDGVVSCEILSDATRHMDLDEFARQVHESCVRYWPG
jgi:sugar phosphate isomerase/epimerase